METHTLEHSFLDVLACPEYRVDPPFDLAVVTEEGGNIITGAFAGNQVRGTPHHAVFSGWRQSSAVNGSGN